MNDYTIDNSIGVLAIPVAIVEYNSRMLYNSYIVLENQLSQIAVETDPALYNKLDVITQSIFNSWVELGHLREEGGKEYGLRE